jgi:transcription initiation factor TFIIIB Brf1 subunit/transcription initiation factor TFIIB
MKHILLTFLIFLTICFGGVVPNCNSCPAQNSIPTDYPYSEYCCRKCSSIVQNKSFDNISKQLFEWSRYKKRCQKSGIYEKYVAAIYLGFQDFNNAIETLECSIGSQDFNIIENATLLGFLYYARGDVEKLSNIAKLLVRKYPQHAGGYGILGIDQMVKGNWNLARKNLEKAYSLMLPHEEAFVKSYLSTVYYEFGMDEEVVNLYYEAYKQKPNEVIIERRPTLTMIASLINLDRLEEAKKLMSEWEKADNTLKDSQDYHNLKKVLEEALKVQDAG